MLAFILNCSKISPLFQFLTLSMKRFISLLSLAMLLAGNVAFTANAATTYSGVEESNAFADAIIYGSASGYTFEKTTEGNDATGSNDVLIGQNTNEVVYFGFDQKFEGVSIDVGTAATGGAASIEYWNGSSWATLAPSDNVDIENGSNGVMSIKWTRPSSWAKTTVNMSFAEDGSTNKASASLYFARLKITSDYSSKAYADQFGILNYNVVFDLTDQLGADIGMELDDATFSSSTGDTTVYGALNIGSGRYGYALYTPSATSYTYTLNVSGFVQESAVVSLNESATLISDSLNYTQVLIARDPNTGNEVSIASATAGTANTTCIISSNRAYCPVPASQDAANATVYANGYAPTSAALSNRALDTTAQASNYLNLNYAYLATVKDSNGSVVTNATVEMGDDSYSIDCTYVSNGQYGCVVPTSDDLGKIRISATGYDTMTTAFSAPRDANSDSQVSQTFTLATSGTTPTPTPTDDDEIDLDVESMEWQDDGDFVFVLQNEGDEDVDDDENVYVSVYVDGDREYYEYFENESGDDFLDAGEDETFNFGDDFLDDQDEEYTVEICVDATDTVNEDDEANNCLEKDLELNSDSDDGIDLEVEDMYMDDDDLILAISNTGDTDVDDNDSVKIYVYVDGDVEYTLVIDENDGDDADFFQEGETSKINVGDNLFDDHGNSYDVEACVDVSDTVDEEDEDNNCREEDEDELEEDVNLASEDTCEDFIDTDGHWGEEYICNLFDRGVVEGYSKYYFKPDEDVTRAEFLKMALLGADKDPYETSGVYYSDVSSSAWYYDYVTYATTKGYVEGYTDGSFHPNDDISRGEALVILLRIAGEDDYDYDSSDIDFSDVETYDWFTWAVVLADDLDLVDGYSDNTFRPTYDISRAEAAKIVDLAYEEFYQD